MKHYRYHSIEQFRNIYKNVQQQTAYKGKDEDGNPIYDYHQLLPTLTFTGSEKLHGTNAAIAFNKDGGFWVQSRERVITPDSDNAGFAQWVQDNPEVVEQLFTRLCDSPYQSPIEPTYVVVYGEWCGANIQPQVALSQLPKMFIVFDIKLVLHYDGKEGLEEYIWLPKEEVSAIIHNLRPLHCVYHFPTYEITIDFNNPDEAINEMVRITDEIENKSPIGAALGVTGIGEGVVWRCGKHIFKVKGRLHSASHVKILAAVDVEKVLNIKECVNKIVTTNRLLQGIDYLKEMGIDLDNKAIKPFIDWVKGDCIKEERDTIEASGLEIGDVVKDISFRAKEYFIEGVLRKL